MIGIRIDNIDKTFGEKQVLRGYSNEFIAGRTSVIMGESGCGKTTLLNIIMGNEYFDNKDVGMITFVNENNEVIESDMIKMSAVFQEDRLCEEFSVIENVLISTKHNRQSKKRAEQLLEKIGLGSEIYSYVDSLSGGMRRRVAIVRALISDYDILLADEPFQGLDDKTKDKVMECFKEETKNKTVILVTHSEFERDFFSGK